MLVSILVKVCIWFSWVYVISQHPKQLQKEEYNVLRLSDKRLLHSFNNSRSNCIPTFHIRRGRSLVANDLQEFIRDVSEGHSKYSRKICSKYKCNCYKWPSQSVRVKFLM